MSQEKFSAEQRAALTHILKGIDRYKNSDMYSRVVLDVSNQFRVNPIREMEEILREIGSDTYFVAFPMEEVAEFDSKLPYPPDIEYPFYLGIWVYGKDGAEKKMKELGVGYEENLLNLENTGARLPK